MTELGCTCWRATAGRIAGLGIVNFLAGFMFGVVGNASTFAKV